MDVIQLAAELAEEFRPRAAELDATGRFPSENYARMRETGYLRALVPEELGGLGASLAEMARAQQALARGCASTALAVNMHQFQVGAAGDNWRAGLPVEPVLRRVANDGVILASTSAEAAVAGAWSPTTTAEKRDGGYVFNGHRFFCSQADGMDIVGVNALDKETGETLIAMVDAHADGVEILQTWDTTGMRATASHEVLLHDVFVPATSVGARLPAGGEPLRHPGFANVARWFLCLVSSVYLGIAEEARAEALRAAGKGKNSSFRDSALTDVMLGELEADYVSALAVRDHVVAELNTRPADPQRGLALAGLLKDVATSKAIAVVDKAVGIAGGASYFRKSPLERLSRDVRAGRFHPPAAPVSYQIVGQRMREAAAAQATEANGAVPV